MADNWRICPRCIKTVNDEEMNAITAVNKLYGKVTLEEWERRKRVQLSECADRRERFAKETMREDFEILTDSEGQFTVDYSARCTAPGCNFKFSYKHEEKVNK